MHHKFYILILLGFLGCNSKQSTTNTLPEKNNVSSNGLFSPKAIGSEKLCKSQETIKVGYAAIACPCAQWILNPKPGKDLTESELIYLEPGNDSLINLNKEWDGKTLPYEFNLKGSFYSELGFPENYITKGQPKPARVFRYISIEKL